LSPGAFRARLRYYGFACLLLPDFEIAREWDGLPAGSSGLAFDAGFERYARGDKDGNVSVRRVANDHQLLTLPGAGVVSPYGGLAFSPDGRFLWQCCHGGHEPVVGFRGRHGRHPDRQHDGPGLVLRQPVAGHAQ
jgi:hypothetical protein